MAWLFGYGRLRRRLHVLRWKSGGQAVVPDVEAVWEQLTVNVSMRVFVLLLCDYNDVFRSIGCTQT